MSVRGPELTSHENPVTLGESRWSRRGMGWIDRGRLWERVAELSVFEKCFCVLIFLKKGTEGNPVFPSACFYVFVERKAELTCSAQ